MGRNEKPSGGQSGFTLIEVMIATLILGIGLLAIGAAFSQGMNSMAQVPLQLVAKEKLLEMRDQIETARYNGGTIPTSKTENLTDVITLPTGRVLNLANAQFKRQTVVTPEAGGFTVDIVVSFVDGSGRSRTLPDSFFIR